MVNDYCITRELEHNVNGEDKEGKLNFNRYGGRI